MSNERSPTQYRGVRAIAPPDLTTAKISPPGGFRPVVKGQLYLDYVGLAVWMWSGSTWIALGTGAVGGVVTLTGDSGGAVSPVGGNIDILGDAVDGMSVVGTAGTLTINAAAASTTQRGTLETSTTAEAIAGSSTLVAVTPAALQAKVGTQTAHGVAMGNTGATSAISWSAAGTAGQAFISGGAAADGAYGTLGVVGGGTGLATLTIHALYVGNGTSAPTALAVGATGQTLMGATAADPAWTGSPSFSGSVTAGTSITASAGAITATNGNIVRGTAGNKDVYTSVASTDTAGANSAGSVALVGGTVVVSTTAVTANSLIRLTCQALGTVIIPSGLCVSAKSAGVSFTILASQATDTSTIFWEIVN